MSLIWTPAQLAMLAKVIDLNGFSAAARALGVPKAAVSRAVADLERALGVRVLERTTRRISLTSAGRLIYPHARRVSDESDAARLAIAKLQAPEGKPLRVVADPTYGRVLLSPLVPRFLAAFPPGAAGSRARCAAARRGLVGELPSARSRPRTRASSGDSSVRRLRSCVRRQPTCSSTVLRRVRMTCARTNCCLPMRRCCRSSGCSCRVAHNGPKFHSPRSSRWMIRACCTRRLLQASGSVFCPSSCAVRGLRPGA